jgi:hypothetical protein
MPKLARVSSLGMFSSYVPNVSDTRSGYDWEKKCGKMCQVIET